MFMNVALASSQDQHFRTPYFWKTLFKHKHKHKQYAREKSWRAWGTRSTGLHVSLLLFICRYHLVGSCIFIYLNVRSMQRRLEWIYAINRAGNVAVVSVGTILITLIYSYLLW